jgi:hypothetical protein
MSNVIPNLYVRIRGRVQGPFDEERLRALVRRGQVSRVHEVSEDGTRWTNAGDFSDLFAQPAGANAHPAGSTGQAGQSGQANQTAAPRHDPAPAAASFVATTHAAPAAHPAAAVANWYYIQGNVTKGPVDFRYLQALCASGQLSADAHVWTEGMAQWAAARTVAGLAPAIQPTSQFEHASTNHSVRSTSADRKLSADVTRALLGSYPWVLFITIMTYVYALAILVGAILIIIAGSKVESPLVIGNGLMTMLTAVLYGVGALLLNLYCLRMSRVQVTRSEPSLEAALNSLRAFWMFVGIVMIVMLAFAVVIGIFVLSAAGEVSSRF